MKKITVQLNWFLVGFYLLLGVACQPTSTDVSLFTLTSIQNTPGSVSVTPKLQLSPTSTPTLALLPTIYFPLTSTETSTPVPTTTPTPLSTFTLTPLPTLSPDETKAEVQRLYETNNGCLLPCWWGITLGLTDWGDAKHFLAPMSFKITERPSQNPDYIGYVFIEVYLEVGQGPHFYVTYNNRVIEMEGYIEMTPLFDPTTILATYGPPSEVRVEGDEYLDIFLFYPEQGFLLEYQTRNGNTEWINGVARGCIRPNGVTYIVVWSPAETFTFSERLQQTTQFRADPAPGLPLEEATGMTIDTFYQTFRNAEPPLCLETPNSLWPGY